MLLTLDWLARFTEADTLFVGFSGGLDSTALLHLLATDPVLHQKLTAVHINHGLSINADKWAQHCQQFCNTLDIPLLIKKVSFSNKANLEERARKERYKVFSTLLKANDYLILAHHRDDQAETVLLQLFRGAGVEGLSAMNPLKKFAQGQLARPLLQHSRQTLVEYTNAFKLRWIEDESNSNCQFSRNFLRRTVIPQLETRWPGVATNLARTAKHCSQAQDLLEELAIIDCPANTFSSALSISALSNLSQVRIANILRLWLKKNAVKVPDTATFNRLIPEVVFAHSHATPEVKWGRYCIRRYQQTLYLLSDVKKVEQKTIQWLSFPQPLSLDSGTLNATPVKEGVSVAPGCMIEVRQRQGGERLALRGQTKSLKKLLQEWQVPVWLRDKIPLIYIDGQLAAVAGYAVSDLFFKTSSSNLYRFSIEGRDPGSEVRDVLNTGLL